jgi:hypothetical protein
MRTREQPVAAAGDMAWDADRRAAARLQCQALRGDRLIERGAGADCDQIGLSTAIPAMPRRSITTSVDCEKPS